MGSIRYNKSSGGVLTPQSLSETWSEAYTNLVRGTFPSGNHNNFEVGPGPVDGIEGYGVTITGGNSFVRGMTPPVDQSKDKAIVIANLNLNGAGNDLNFLHDNASALSEQHKVICPGSTDFSIWDNETALAVWSTDHGKWFILDRRRS